MAVEMETLCVCFIRLGGGCWGFIMLGGYLSSEEKKAGPSLSNLRS